MGRPEIHAAPLVHPTDDVVAVIDDAPRADATIHALRGAGFAETDIHVFRGRDEIGTLAVAWLRHANLPTFLTPILAAVLDDGRKVREICDAYALAGHVVIAVHTRNVDDVDEATRVLRDNGARDTWYLGRWTKAAPDLVRAGARDDHGD